MSVNIMPSTVPGTWQALKYAYWMNLFKLRDANDLSMHYLKNIASDV